LSATQSTATVRVDRRRAPGAPRIFHRTLRGFLEDLSAPVRRFWLAVLATGAIAGLGAVILVEILDVVQALCWSTGGINEASATAAPPLRRLVVPIAAAVLVTFVAVVMRQPLSGQGTAGVIEAIWVTNGRLPLGRTLVRGLASIVSVGMGASVGREGALIQGGAATGSELGRRLGLTTDQIRLLVACGASAGIAAAYNVPIGATLFALEVLLGSFALELFGPVVVSSVVATIISRMLIFGHPTYEIPDYELSLPRQLLLAPIIGLVLGVASALFVRVIDGAAALVDRVPRRLALFLPVAGMGALGVAAMWFPQLLGNGYEAVNAELLGGLPLGLLLGLPFLKLLATAVCASSGVPGGMFTPSLFYGALLGGAVGLVAHQVVPEAGPPSAYALLGMGAALAGTTHAALCATVMIFELTGSYGVILPLMLASVTSAAVSRRLAPESLYTAPLRRRKVRLPERPRPEWLGATAARAVLRPEAPRIEPTARFEEVLLRLYSLPAGQDLYVVGPDDRFLGVLSLDALKGHIVDQRHLAVVIAADIMDARVRPVRADDTLAVVASRFGETWLDKLPVVDEAGRLAGTVSATDVLRRGRF
jgi:CIC family chloride channel protein